MEHLEGEHRTAADLHTSGPGVPDPNPGWLDQETHVRILATVAVIGVAGWVVGYRSADLMLTFMATFLAVYAAFMIVSVREIPFLSKRVEAFIEEWIREEGKFSFYGLMAATYFVKWEVHLLIRDLRTFQLDTDNVIGAFLQWGLGFSVQSIMNALSTLIWPAHAVTEYALIPAIVLVAICWGLVRLGSRAFFTPEWMLEAEGGEASGEAEGADDGTDASGGAGTPDEDAPPEAREGPRRD